MAAATAGQYETRGNRVPRTIETMAEQLRVGYARDLLTGIRGPTSMFADTVEVRYIPPRSMDGWIDGAKLHNYQDIEAAALRSVIPDAHLTDVQVITRADDQIIVVMLLTGTLADGTPFRCPATMVYDVRGDKIVRVIGLYDQQSLTVFTEAFEEADRTQKSPVELAPRGKQDSGSTA